MPFSVKYNQYQLCQIHPDELKFKGISKNDLGIKSIELLQDIAVAEKASWEEQLQKWQTSLNQVAAEFLQGNAEVNPKNPADTCRHCQLKFACRINEKSL